MYMYIHIYIHIDHLMAVGERTQRRFAHVELGEGWKPLEH